MSADKVDASSAMASVAAATREKRSRFCGFNTISSLQYRSFRRRNSCTASGRRADQATNPGTIILPRRQIVYARRSETGETKHAELGRAGFFPSEWRQVQIGGAPQVGLGVGDGLFLSLFDVFDFLGGRDPLPGVDVVDRYLHALSIVLGE